MMYPWASYKEKMRKKIFFAYLKTMKKVVGSGAGSGDGSRAGSDPSVRGTDPGIRIRTKMSRIPCKFKKLDFSGCTPRTLSTRMCVHVLYVVGHRVHIFLEIKQG
jgi:hypothetical protein